jgi:hypothetical protein
VNPWPVKRPWSGAKAIAGHIPRQGSPTNPYLAGAEILVDSDKGSENNDKEKEEFEDFDTEGILRCMIGLPLSNGVSASFRFCGRGCDRC